MAGENVRVVLAAARVRAELDATACDGDIGERTAA
jgi:hypothetical protein